MYPRGNIVFCIVLLYSVYGTYTIFISLITRYILIILMMCDVVCFFPPPTPTSTYIPAVSKR